MPPSSCLENTKHNLLQQLFASATHDASAAMCCWTNSLIRLTLDEVREIPLQDVCSELNVGDELLTIVAINLEGQIGGALLLTFDEENGRRLAVSLVGGEAETASDWSELEKSALTETGNILGCAYVNAITRLIDRPLVPSAPCFIQDYGASVLQQALMVQAAVTDTVLICRTGFHHEGEELNWLLLFVPTLAMREAMENVLS